MSDLEKYLVENRASFDLDEPENGHFERFKARLGQGRVRKNPWLTALQLAASLAIIISGGLVIFQLNKSGDKMAVTTLPPEVAEANDYYARQVDLKYEEIAGFSFESAKEKEILLDELSEMDEYYKQLLKDLNANPGDERAINALITHYQTKLEVMDQIIQQLNQFKNQNAPHHEESL